MAQPFLAYIATIQPGLSVAISSNWTATAVNTGWELRFPLKINFGNVSADPLVQIYRSTDGGTVFDTLPMMSYSIDRAAANSANSKSIALPPGVFAIRVTTSGPSAQTIQVLTAESVTGEA